MAPHVSVFLLVRMIWLVMDTVDRLLENKPNDLCYTLVRIYPEGEKDICLEYQEAAQRMAHRQVSNEPLLKKSLPE